MTKRDFELVARVLRNAAMSGIADVDEVAARFADEFAQINPHFNREKFLAASRGEKE